MPRLRGPVLAFGLSCAALAIQSHAHRETLARHDRHVLPAFDAYVYMAMADHPDVFTVGPWGYRVLTPALVRALPVDTAGGFRAVTFAGLALSGGLLFLFLRRLGHGEAASLAAVAAFGLSPSVSATVEYTFLTEPLALALELALLLALERTGGRGLLALIAALGMLAKDAFVLFLPALYFARRDREGRRGALLSLAAGACAAGAVSVALRAWTPQLPPQPTGWDRDTFWLAVYRILAGWQDWWRPVLLGGVLPLAALGALRAPARPLLRRHGYLLLITLALPFAASVYTTDSRSVPFFAADIPRLLLFALPLLLPLALCAVDRVRPHLRAPPPPAAVPGRLAVAAAALAVIVLSFRLLDPYRRIDLRGPRDGRLVLALCRESLAFAQRLARGRPVAYDPEARRFTPQKSDPHLLERMRWFLRDGWGRMPHYGMGKVVMEEAEATVILPCLVPADWDLTLVLSAAAPARLRAAVNDTRLGELAVGPEPSRHRLELPAAALFRGDNLLRLQVDDAAAAPRLHQLLARPRP